MGVIVKTPSGFTLEITTLPPYYMDFIEDANPFLNYPVVKYTNVAGDSFDLEYRPPDVPPDPDDEENYLLYRRWHEVTTRNLEIETVRRRARRDFLLSVCVKVVDGPVSFVDDDWICELEAIDYEVPDHPGKEKVAFLKAKVILSEDDWLVIQQHTIFPAVTVDGVYAAIRAMRIRWDDVDVVEVVSKLDASSLVHDIPVSWELEVSKEYGIPFDETWYKIPAITREYMIAAHLGRKWGDRLIEDEAVAKAKRIRK